MPRPAADRVLRRHRPRPITAGSTKPGTGSTPALPAPTTPPTSCAGSSCTDAPCGTWRTRGRPGKPPRTSSAAPSTQAFAGSSNTRSSTVIYTRSTEQREGNLSHSRNSTLASTVPSRTLESRRPIRYRRGMTDGELPGRPATNLIHEGDDDAVYLPAARGTTGPSIRRAEPPKDYTTEIRFLAADFERSAGGYIQELTIEYPEASHAVQSLISSFKQYADDIARIAQMQNDLLQAIISRIPPQALSSVSIYLDDDEDSAARYEVERQVVRLIESANGVVVDADHAIRGSWFRRMRALFAESEAGRDALTLGAQAATSKIVNASNAQNTAALMQNIGQLL